MYHHLLFWFIAIWSIVLVCCFAFDLERKTQEPNSARLDHARREAKRAFKDALSTVHVRDEVKDNAIDKLIDYVVAEISERR